MPDEAGGEAGFVLVAVLAVVVLFVAVSASFAVKARLHLLQAANRQDAARLQAVVDGAALFAADALRPAATTGATGGQVLDGAGPAMAVTTAEAPPRPPPPALPLPVDGTPVDCPVGAGARLVVSVSDQGGLVDLNGAPAAMLAAIFAAAGLDGLAAGRLAEEIVDFRDPDDAPTGTGIGEAAAYAARGLAWGPRNAPFADVEEIGQLPSAAEAWRVRALLTVNNPRAAVDLTAMNRRARALLPAEADGEPSLSRWLAQSPRLDFAVETQLFRADGSLGAGRRALVSFRDGAGGAVRVLRWSRLPPLGDEVTTGATGDAGEGFCAALSAALGEVQAK
ncbi:type II secretion system protein GspK [Antarcticirhabdus aurantiaca]|uniref:Type II secretion system protein GspK n=1 Tax=Antarcticirhabdus aurantiaca TaxID=2606717 RepID=A0ACD4NM38_9HYPH|nr:type II secretion system protein GspK [Antarcticirhabdus aurantiaca]WAJ27829.1 type II secretion system protein GspK [Jeongeuplla avenae]